jgi:hypothetical protein
MRFRRALPAFLLALSIPTAGAAGQDAPPATAKVAGNWDFSFTSPQGAMTWRVKFDQAGDTLTGHAESDFGTLPMREGWITGNDLSFGLLLSLEGQSFTVYFTGTVKGDTADGSIEVPNSGLQPIAFRAIRVANDEASSGALHQTGVARLERRGTRIAMK